ncbi:Versican core protein [Rhizoctonia solani]|uniref:Versican core protein n=1 Tax=Rhizoctonia solani TaxID=456999 RepID=A0A0K6G619_9AGAM|nr:Versican core protein [Rhizoctonia solani]
MTRTQDDHLRGLLNSRSARSGPPAAFSPTPTAFSLSSPRPGLYTSPRPTERSSPSCYSRSQMSVDDSCSDISDDHPTLYRSRSQDKYRGSYVDPMRDSSEDERTEAHLDVQGSGSNDTLSDTGMLRPVESDTSVSSALSVDPNPDPRLSFLGPKTRMISKAPWEEVGADEEAVSDTEAADTLSMFAGKLKGKGRSRSRTLTQCKAEVERRFLGGGWGRTSSDTRPSMDSSKRSIESSVPSYIQTPTSPRNGSFSDVIRGVSARTPSLFSASSATSSGAGVRPRGGSNAGIQINTYHLDSRGTSPVSSSPTTSNFIHPYANLELLSAGTSRDGEASPSRSNSSATLTASTVSSYVTPSSTTSSATSPEQHEQQPSNPKKEKHRPPHIAVFPLNRGASNASSAKSPSALSISFVPLSPTSMSGSSAGQEQVPSGMRVFPGSPAYNLIPLEQAQQAQIQMRARERSKSITSNTSQSVVSPRPKEIVHKKSKPALGPVGGGFSSVIAGGSPSPQWNGEEARVRTVSAGSAPRGRSRGYTVTSVASQSTTSVNIIPGSAIENIPEPKSTGGTPMETVPARQLKLKRSGFLKFWNKNGTSSGNPNISSPVGPVHVSHNGVDLPPPVPKVPTQYQTSKAASPSEMAARRELPPVVVSPAHGRAQSLERSQSVSDDSHTSIGGHNLNGQGKLHQHRSNTEPLKPVEDEVNPQDASFGLKLRPVSSVFKGMPEDYLTGSPKVAKSRGSSESRNGDSSGFEDSNALSPATPYFPQSARSCRTHVSTTSSGSDAFSSSVDPRTPSSLVFPPSVPRSSTDSQSASIIASLREQIEGLRRASQQQISDLENQVQSLKAELEASKCDRCGRNERRSESSIMNRPRAPTGTGCRTALGSSYD